LYHVGKIRRLLLTEVGAFLADPTLNRILTSAQSDIRIRSILDEGKLLLVNLAKARLASHVQLA
jgi:hypothetical protein